MNKLTVYNGKPFWMDDLMGRLLRLGIVEMYWDGAAGWFGLRVRQKEAEE